MSRRPPTLDSRTRGTYRDDHGTPKWILDAVREMHRRIDLDLASSADDNRVVRAGRFFSVENPCPEHPEINPDDVVWCNPPGPARNVKWFWEVWKDCIKRRDVSGAFLAFSIDHLRLLSPPPRTLLVCALRQRVQYRGNKHALPVGSALITTSTNRTYPKIGTWMIWGA